MKVRLYYDLKLHLSTFGYRHKIKLSCRFLLIDIRQYRDLIIVNYMFYK